MYWSYPILPFGVVACTFFPTTFLEIAVYDDEFSILVLNLNKIFKNSTPGKVACIWHIDRVQIDAIKFERRQIDCRRRRHCVRSLTTSVGGSTQLSKVSLTFLTPFTRKRNQDNDNSPRRENFHHPRIVCSKQAQFPLHLETPNWYYPYLPST